jgi:hypothetical protein
MDCVVLHRYTELSVYCATLIGGLNNATTIETITVEPTAAMEPALLVLPILPLKHIANGIKK